jgi:hypothetical protein
MAMELKLIKGRRLLQQLGSGRGRQAPLKIRHALAEGQIE